MKPIDAPYWLVIRAIDIEKADPKNVIGRFPCVEPPDRAKLEAEHGPVMVRFIMSGKDCHRECRCGFCRCTDCLEAWERVQDAIDTEDRLQVP